MATAELKVMPRFRALEIVEPPRSRLEAPDVLTRPHRFATEDHFRFKEYAPGDDTRRIHWRLSIRSGRLQVRRPETRETTTRRVVLVLDDYLPPGRMLDDAVGMADVLDHLVETWISLAKELVERGDQVTLVAAVDDGDGRLRVEREGGGGPDRRRWQDLGARACWQGALDLPEVLAHVADDVHAVAVSSRFRAPPPQMRAGQDLTWVYLPPLQALGKRQTPFWLEVVGPGPAALARLFALIVRLPGPAGADENSLTRQVRDVWEAWRVHRARRRLRWAAWREGERAMGELLARGETVYRLEPGPQHHKLVGLQAKAARRTKAA
jgi:hypothetical protein